MYLDSKNMTENLHKSSMEPRHFVAVCSRNQDVLVEYEKTPNMSDNPALSILVLNVLQ